jgi:hypothetical protein
MNTALAIAETASIAETPAEKPARRGLALVGTLLAGSLGVAAGIAIALLIAAALFSVQ